MARESPDGFHGPNPAAPSRGCAAVRGAAAAGEPACAAKPRPSVSHANLLPSAARGGAFKCE
jgi:hypothetical protein